MRPLCFPDQQYTVGVKKLLAEGKTLLTKKTTSPAGCCNHQRQYCKSWDSNHIRPMRCVIFEHCSANGFLSSQRTVHRIVCQHLQFWKVSAPRVPEQLSRPYAWWGASTACRVVLQRGRRCWRESEPMKNSWPAFQHPRQTFILLAFVSLARKDGVVTGC